jgi:hypothetical protein
VAKGRLWVVCEHCERWNLTPLETRWEAIEEAERLYRATALRVSTDNIGLAQSREGLELVRIGAPPKVEFAAWRYGDQFGRRHRRHVVLSAGAAVGILVPAAINLVGAAGVVVGAGAAASGAALTFAYLLGTQIRRGSGKVPKVFLRDDEESLLRLTPVNVRCVAFVPDGSADGWHLKVPHLIQLGVIGKGATLPAPTDARLTGTNAERALTKILPFLNRDGGNTRRVRDAVDLLAASPTLGHLLRVASTNTEARKTHFKIKDGESNVGVLPGRIRLALEMSLHEDDERRAMEGELTGLEQRWRDAEAIAGIADSLLLPEGVAARVNEWRSDSR